MYKTHFLLKLKRSSDEMHLFAKVKLKKRIIGAKHLEVQSISLSPDYYHYKSGIIVCCNIIDKSKRYTNFLNLKYKKNGDGSQIGVMMRNDIVVHFLKYLQIQRVPIEKDFIDEILIEIFNVEPFYFSDREESTSFIQLVIYHDQN